MATIVDFTAEVVGSSVTFTNTSPTPTTSWEWDFGDGSPREITENASHTYDNPGRYTVVLVAVGEDGPSSKILNIDILNITQITIEQYLAVYMPPGLSIIEPTKTDLRKHWQVYLSSLLSPEIPSDEIFNDLYWPSLANALVAKMMIRDAYKKSAAGALILAMGTGSSSGQQGNTSLGPKKMIETGPTKVEWHDASTTIKAYLNSKVTQGGSLFDSLDADICGLASRIRVKLPFCPPLSHSTVVPQKAIPTNPPTNPINRRY